ncbi:MAG TPA: aldose 1-epimerase family protein [Planctomycetaceae bacterium]|jgi:galactose mutarotase-like enzyme|nr:aldose 1-epimerase family protein [Planctomycetaceae bacterium]
MKSVVLTDVAEGVWSDTFELRESADLRLAGAGNWSIRKRTLRGGVSAGVDVVELHNGALNVSILPTRGMGLWRGNYRGIDVGWNSPVKQPVNPSYVNETDRNGLGWLTGFNELLCRCGLSSNGGPGLDVIVDNTGQKTEAPLTLHGKIANTPADRVEVTVSTEGNGLLSVSGIVDETMLFGPCLRLKTTYETVPGSNRLTIRDEVLNVAGRPMELELLYHTNLGRPFLDVGSRLVLPIREAAPRDARAAEDIKTWQTYLGPTASYTEQCYFADLIGDDQEKTVVLLRNAAGDRGVSLEYSIRQLPCFTVWKCTQAEADGYVTGMEPATNLPNHKTFERKQGRVITLAPGASHASRIELAVHTSTAEVTTVENRIGELQNRAHPIVHERPISKYSPT